MTLHHKTKSRQTWIFYASPPKVPEALCFPGCPSGCPSGFFRLRDNSSINWWNFIKLGQKVKLDVTIKLIRFWVRSAQRQGSKVQWIWSKYAIFTSFTRNLKNPWGGFSSNLVQGCTTRSRGNWLDFGRDPPNVKGPKVNEFGLNMLVLPRLRENLKNPWVDFHQTWYRGAPPGVDELIRFWARSAQRQGSKVNELRINRRVASRRALAWWHDTRVHIPCRRALA